MRKVILITGLMGSGKSKASEFLRECGFDVIDMDYMAKTTIHNELRKKFWYAFDKDPLDQVQMSECRYFQECYEDERKSFEAELDDYLSERIRYIVSERTDRKYETQMEPLFIECPAVLPDRFKNFISKFKSAITNVLLIKRAPELRNLIIKVRNISEYTYEERLRLQSEDIPVDEKLITVIENNDSLEKFKLNLKKFLNKIR